MNKNDVIKHIETNSATYKKASDYIWEKPELRFELKESADHLIEILKQEAFTIERDLADMEDAFVATYGSGGPVIAFLGEYDALPNLSQVPDVLEKQSLVKGDSGHGCGHHALGTASLASAVAIKEYLRSNNRSGTVKFFGCPAEEGGSGKAYMARAGVFEGLDAIITWHPMNENRVWGESSLANFQVSFNFKGISAHAAAAPHEGRSALDAAELMNIGVNYLREHIIQDARVHYAYTDVGGGAPNVVQPTASLLYFIRAPKSTQVKAIFDRIVKIAEGAALMTETELEVVWDSAASDYVVNKVLAHTMQENMESLGGTAYSEEEKAYAQRYVETLSENEKSSNEKKVRSGFKNLSEEQVKELIEEPILGKVYPLNLSQVVLPGSTDVGDASQNAPTVQCLTASYPAGTSPHSWQWVATGKGPILHKGMLFASKVMAATAVDLYEDPVILERASEEFQWKMPKGYKNYIPEDVKPQ